MLCANVPLPKLKTKEANFKPQNFTKMTADQFTDKVDGITNDFTTGITTETQFKHAIQDLLLEVLYNNEDLKAHYIKQYEQQKQAWEYQTLVSH